MKKKGAITIYDIARELNVSTSTVSRALKNHHSIGKKTKKAVIKLAQQYGYQPNAIAASLRNNKTNTIGVITSWINRPFISSLISGIEMEANKSGYNVIISQTHDSYQSEMANAQALYASRVEGLIVSLAMETTKYGHFDQFIKSNIPLVFVDRVPDEITATKVVIDDYSAGFKATEHLIEQGCKHIAHIGGALHRNIYRERRNGYLDALKKHNLTIDENLVLECEVLSADETLKICRQLFSSSSKIDGLFTSNDTAAISAIQYAKNFGIQIPQDLAVIGFNNDPISTIIVPALSTIKHPAEEMGLIAAKQVLDIKQHKEIVSAKIIVLETEVIPRESSLRLASVQNLPQSS